MEKNETTILDSTFVAPQKTRRRALLPWWIKMFCWVFMVFGALVPFGLIVGLFGGQFQLSLYGLETSQPLSGTGLLISGIFLMKAASAYGLWTEKSWAVNASQIIAVIGISVCGFMMLIYPFLDAPSGFRFTFRLELLLLVPFLLKLNKIKAAWNQSAIESSVTADRS